MPDDHRPPSDADLERVLTDFDGLMHRLMIAHAPDLNLVELTMSQTKAMYIVIADGPQRMSELATHLHVTNSTATGQVDRLVELGLLERHVEAADRRQVVVKATPLGEESLERFRELNSHRMRQMLSRIDRADLATVGRAVGILAATIEAAAGTPTAINSTIEGPTK
jgi:DNA-binding MarR family transcriptional regulator